MIFGDRLKQLRLKHNVKMCIRDRNKEYYIKTSCCEKVSKIAPEIGRRIEKGEEVNLNIDEIDFGQIEDNVKICTNCGYTTEEDFIYCPKCSNKL